ncbi:MAG TPA: HEPN domain-containing protein [Patescibacteria group bacterium]|jgi:tryptophan 2,3-dioxygenase|nr:HEPN domain-containing protein [Patescibacteria group bacterium]
MDKKKLEEELETRLTSRGLIMYAWDYFKSFEDLHEKHPKPISRYEVKYYLLCHAIELAMKAYLREKGYTRKQLLDIGHDLEKLIKELHSNEVLMDVDSMVRTFTANQYYKTKQFEYPQTGFKELPNLDSMRDSVKLLLDMVSNSIFKKFPLSPEQKK